MTMKESIVIVSARSHPDGRVSGRFQQRQRQRAGSRGRARVVSRAGIAPEQVDELLFGNCLMASQGRAPANRLRSREGLPASVNCTTLSKMWLGHENHHAWP